DVDFHERHRRLAVEHVVERRRLHLDRLAARVPRFVGPEPEAAVPRPPYDVGERRATGAVRERQLVYAHGREASAQPGGEEWQRLERVVPAGRRQPYQLAQQRAAVGADVDAVRIRAQDEAHDGACERVVALIRVAGADAAVDGARGGFERRAGEEPADRAVHLRIRTLRWRGPSQRPAGYL